MGPRSETEKAAQSQKRVSVELPGVVVNVQFLNQFFWPDEAATSQLLGDLIGPVDEVCLVTVVCGPVGYAGSAVGGAAPGVRIVRVGTARFEWSFGAKLLSYAGFAFGAARHTCFGERAEVVVTMTTPPLLSLLGWVAQSWRGSRHFVWEMDMYPDVAVALGTFRAGGLRDRVVGWLADAARRRADGVIALGPCMAERLEMRGVRRERIVIAENWADGAAIRPMPFRRDGVLRVLYSGNLGLAHEFETVLGAAGTVGEGVEFLFSGAGPRLAAMRSASAGLPNVRFGGFVARAELGTLLGSGDIGLVTQRPETLGCLVPSKVYGVMAAGRPLLFIGPGAATPARMIRETGCGWHFETGDVAGVAGLLRRLRGGMDEVEEVGRRARVVFEERYDLPLGVARVLRAIRAATER